MQESIAPGSPPETQPAGGTARSPSGPDAASSPLQDPRALQILTTEHWSLLSARALVYNEAFSRAGMFLAFLSMSFVAIGLAGPALSFDRRFLDLASIILLFDMAIGLATLGRIFDARDDDLRAIQGMNRIRHGYVEMVPAVAPYLTTSIHDDMAGVLVTYGPNNFSGLQSLIHGLTTTGGMVGLTVSLIAGRAGRRRGSGCGRTAVAGPGRRGPGLGRAIRGGGHLLGAVDDPDAKDAREPVPDAAASGPQNPRQSAPLLNRRPDIHTSLGICRKGMRSRWPRRTAASAKRRERSTCRT
jgi:hypothetical protein